MRTLLAPKLLIGSVAFINQRASSSLLRFSDKPASQAIEAAFTSGGVTSTAYDGALAIYLTGPSIPQASLMCSGWGIVIASGSRIGSCLPDDTG